MKRKEKSVLLAGLLAMVLAGCSGMRGGDSAGAMAPTASASDITTAGADSDASMAGTGSSGASGAMGAGATGAPGRSTPSASTGAPNSTVTSIEVIARQSGAAATGAGTVRSVSNYLRPVL